MLRIKPGLFYQGEQGEGGGVTDGSGELSGPVWVPRFPTSTDLGTLEAGFQANVRRFIKALEDAGARVNVTATRRPVERAYLMHFAFLIARQNIDPSTVPKKAGVNILWVHPTPAESRQAAQQMCDGYGINNLGVAPALASRHTQDRAIDMTISWTGTLTIRQANGTTTAIASKPRDGTNAALITVGKTYGVIHLLAVAKDPVHWSVDGR
jgi:hypothetical protein